MASQLYQPYNISGQTVLITGASSGIGQACAWRFAEAGCKLVLIARRVERLQALQKELVEKYKVGVHIVPLDVRDVEAIQKLPGQLPAGFQQVDILVNNAGLVLGMDGVAGNNLEDCKVMIETNTTAVVAFTQAFVQGMLERDSGHIVNMSSTAGHEAYAGGSVYCGTKHFVDAFTTASRHDLVGSNIRVTSISPGLVQTEFSVVRFKGDQSKADAVYQGFTPLFAQDVADNVLYACTRPQHVQIADILIMATHQCSARGVARKPTQQQ